VIAPSPLRRSIAVEGAQIAVKSKRSRGYNIVQCETSAIWATRGQRRDFAFRACSAHK